MSEAETSLGLASQALHATQTVVAEAAGYAAQAAGARDTAQTLVAAALVGGQDIGYRAAWAAANIPAEIKSLRTTGYAANGDGGAALYTRADQASPGSFQDAGGQHWALAEPITTPTMFGAPTDGLSLASTNLNAAVDRGGLIEVRRGRYLIDTAITVGTSDTQLRFARDAFIMPSGDHLAHACFIGGSAPTSWVALSADASVGDNIIQFAADPGWAVGDWVELRSQKLVAGPNTQGCKIGCLRKITAKIGSGPVVLTLHAPLKDPFRVADTAIAGKPRMVENVVIDGLQANREDFTSLLGFGIRINYAAHVRIVFPAIFGSKPRNGPDDESWDAIKIMNAYDVEIFSPTLAHLGWYGVSLSGMAEHVRVWGGIGHDMRHAISVVWSEAYGEPTDLIVDGMKADSTNLSGFDTHDTGRDIVFRNCVSERAGDDGFQVRNIGTRLEGCIGRYAANDGLGGEVFATDWVAKDCTFERNNRCGVFCKADGELIDSRVVDNNGAVSGSRGVIMTGGRIKGGRITGNRLAAVSHGQISAPYLQNPLVIEGVYMPGDAVQTSATLVSSTGAQTYDKLAIEDCVLFGYNQLFQFTQQVPATGYGPPKTRNNRVSDTPAQVRGKAVLFRGRAVVLTPAVRSRSNVDYYADLATRVDFRRMVPNGAVGQLYVGEVVDGVSFEILSTSKGEPDRTNSIRNSSMAGAVVGTVGSGGALPTNWLSQTLNGLVIEVVSVGPVGDDKPEIQLRIRGTPTATSTANIYFDANTAVAAAEGDRWILSLEHRLIAGSVSNLRYTSLSIVERTAAGANVGGGPTTNFTATAFSRKVEASRVLSTGLAVERVQGGLAIGYTANAAIDITLGIRAPQLEKVTDATERASAFIKTNGGAQSRTSDPLASDNSVVEWTLTL